MTPLEALHSFDHWIQVEFADQFKIIEKALKDSEKTDKYYAKLLESVLNDKEHKALEIIKRTGLNVDWFIGTFIKQDIGYSGFLICLEEMGTDGHLAKQLMMSEEQFDLLKEVLK